MNNIDILDLYIYYNNILADESKMSGGRDVFV